jgi:1,2-diacylglycerol 3-alpha-glucosyltransferase
MNAMRIAIASSGLGHVARGIESWADDLGSALAARGENVKLCKGAGLASRSYERVVWCFQRDGPLTVRLSKLMPRRISWRLGLGSCHNLEQTSFAFNLMPVLRLEKIDILHVQDPQVAIIIQRARQLGLVRTRTILAHGTEEDLSFLRRIRYLQHLAPWHLERARAAGVFRNTWSAIPNFIDTKRFSPGRADAMREELGIPRDALIILTAAAIKRSHKRIDHLIAEFARLRQMNAELPVWLIVAGGWERDTEELIAEGTRLLGERVRFLVRFPRQRMPELYRAADLFTLCSLFEMMPVALIEATASGLPCVVHKQPIFEWMTGKGGPAIDMSAPGELAATLQNLLTTTELRGELSRAARRHCLDNFSQEIVVDQILNYYQLVMKRPWAKEL